MLYSAKYIKKNSFKSSAREDATFHSTSISHTQIGGKLENILNILNIPKKAHSACSTSDSHVCMSDHWRRLQHTFQCFQTKTCHAARRMKSFRKGHVTCQMLSIKTTVFSFVLYKRYPVGTSNISIKRSGKYSSDFTQNFAGGKN